MSITDVLALQAAAIADLMEEAESIPKDNLPALLAAFVAVKNLRSSIEEQYDTINSYYTKLNTLTLPELLKEMKIDALKSGGYNFSLGSDLLAGIPLHKTEEGFKWLKENNLGDIIKEGVNPKTLSSALKSYIESTGISPPEDAISIHFKDKINVRKVQ